MNKAQLEIPQERLKPQTSETSKVNVVEMKKSIVILNSADSLFGEIRDRNFHAINHVLSRTAKELQQANEVYLINFEFFFKYLDQRFLFENVDEKSFN